MSSYTADLQLEEWRELPLEDREAWGLKYRGCAYASPLWDDSSHCRHPRCRVLRQEAHPIVILNSYLFYELYDGYLKSWRRSQDPRKRQKLAQVLWYIRQQARQSGVYDPWKIPGVWQLFVSAALT